MTEKAPEATLPQQKQKVCGIVRPIAAMNDYPSSHWDDVHDIICESSYDAGFTPRLVSENAAGGVILSDIVSNLYNNEVVVADVSGRNPNVMFELGMRMAFEKPVVIIIDDDTPFSFDISPVKHLQYPRTLRFADIKKFKRELSAALSGSVEAFGQKGYRGYLQQFGNIEVSKLEAQHLDVQSIANGMVEIQRSISRISNAVSHSDVFLNSEQQLAQNRDKANESDLKRRGLIRRNVAGTIAMSIDGPIADEDIAALTNYPNVLQVNIDRVNGKKTMLKIGVRPELKTIGFASSIMEQLRAMGYSPSLEPASN
jgi:hypothetical protein